MLNENESWISASEKLACETIMYFSDLVFIISGYISIPRHYMYKILSDKDRSNLCRPFQLEEIKSSLF